MEKVIIAATILCAQAAYMTLIEIFGRLSELNNEDQTVKILLARVYESK